MMFIPSSADGCLGGVHVLAIMNNDAMNILVQVFMCTYVFHHFWYVPSNGTGHILCHRATVCLTL